MGVRPDVDLMSVWNRLIHFMICVRLIHINIEAVGMNHEANQMFLS